MVSAQISHPWSGISSINLLIHFSGTSWMEVGRHYDTSKEAWPLLSGPYLYFVLRLITIIPLSRIMNIDPIKYITLVTHSWSKTHILWFMLRPGGGGWEKDIIVSGEWVIILQILKDVSPLHALGRHLLLLLLGHALGHLLGGQSSWHISRERELCKNCGALTISRFAWVAYLLEGAS